MTETRSHADFEALRDEWNALSAHMASPLVDHEWFASSARAFHADGSLQVVLHRDRGTLAAAAPLAFSDAGRRRLTLVGSTALYEPGEWVHDSEVALESLARTVAGIGTPVVVPRVPRASALCSAVASATRLRAVTIVRNSASSFGVDVEGDWQAYCSRLSARTLKRLAMARERAEREVGPITIAMLTPAPAEVDDLLAALVKVEGAGWKGRTGSALAARPDLRSFFSDYGRRLAVRREFRVSTLSIGATIAAVEISVEAHGRRWGLKVTYDEGAAPYAPALQLLHASIRQAFELGLRSYEFLGVAESWQERWKPHRREYVALALYPVSPRGVVCAAADAYSAASRRFGQLRAGLRKPTMGRVA